MKDTISHPHVRAHAGYRLLWLLTILFVLAIGIAAQVATGGPYTLNQSVVATGGGTSSGGTLTVEGTAGQSVAGQQVSNGPHSVHAGFWNGPPLIPSAASVSVAGRIQTSDGSGIRNVRVTLISPNGTRRTVITSAFGYFQFDEVMVGETYIVSAQSKRFQFAQPDQVVTVLDLVDDLVFTALNM